MRLVIIIISPTNYPPATTHTVFLSLSLFFHFSKQYSLLHCPTISSLSIKFSSSSSSSSSLDWRKQGNKESFFFFFGIEESKGKERDRGRENKGERRKRKFWFNNQIESYSNHVNMHDYCSIFGYVWCYRLTDVGSFWTKMCKIRHFFVFSMD